MEAIGTYISVFGLGALFAGDIVILTMAVILDVAKIVTVSFLYQYWDDIKSIMKYYLLAAVIILMTVTSVGAFGYLSGSFQKAISPNTESTLQIDSLKQERDSLVAEKDQLNNQRADINKQIAQLPTDAVKGRRALIASFKPETNRISERLIVITHKVDDLNTKVLKDESENISKSVHVGPILYVAKAFNITVEDASKWIIMTIIFVFDPLAIMLILAGNFLVKRKELEPIILKPEAPIALKYESPGVPLTVVDINECFNPNGSAGVIVEPELTVEEMFVELEKSHPEAKAAHEAGEQWVQDTFNPDVFLSAEPMTDEEFDVDVQPDDDEVPIEEVDFTDLRGMDDLGEVFTDDIVTYIPEPEPEPEPLTEEEIVQSWETDELLSLVYDDIDTGEAPSEEIDTEALELAFKDYVPVIPVAEDVVIIEEPLVVEPPLTVKKSSSTDLDLSPIVSLSGPLETCSLDTLKIDMPEALIRIGVTTPSIKRWFYEN